MGRLVLFLGLYSCAFTALAPAFCVAGVLPHPCESTHQGPCEHEDDCSVDPCNAVYVRPDVTDTIDLEPQGDCLYLSTEPVSDLPALGLARSESPPRGGFKLLALQAVILLI